MEKEPWDKEYRRKDPWDENPFEPTGPIDPKAYRLVVPEKSDLLAGLIYLPLHMFLIGELIAFVLIATGRGIDLLELNIIYMLVGTVYLMATMRRYLQESFIRFLHFGWSNLWVMPVGYAIRFALGIPVTVILLALTPELANPNEEIIRDIIDQNLLPSIFMAVILAPIVEELLFRGVIFAPLRKYSRALAYAVSTLLFAFLHVSAFIFFAFDLNLLLVMLVYVPAGISLCWVYEKSGSIWTAIFLHALMNLVAVLLGPWLV